jgi:acyl-CoA dehydrogenase
MSWSFETEPEFQLKLDWAQELVSTQVAPLDYLLGSVCDVKNPENIRLVRPLQKKVKEQGLWACHLGPHLGGQGFGQVKLALLNEILGRASFGPVVFGCQAPDSGNAEILAHYGTAEQKERFLAPLLDNHIVSCFSMTEPQGGSDPLVFTTRAELDGEEWVINGEKWFSSNARWSDFLIVMALTDPGAAPHARMSLFIVPSDTAGIEILRDVGFAGERVPAHAYIRYTDVRVPKDHLLGERGHGFAVAQTRLGGGRIHHAMRTIGQARRAFDMMCERALSRYTQGERLADKQLVQEKIADSWIELEQFRLLVLRTAWLIDKHQDYMKVRKDIAAVKAAMPKVLQEIASRALQVHGSLGISNEMPFMNQIALSFVMGLADGPTEVHKVTVARQVLRDYQPASELFPKYSMIALRERALEQYGAVPGQPGQHGVS